MTSSLVSIKEHTVRAIAIPGRMARLKLDARGYPVPWSVFVDNDGLPHFAINVEEIRQRCLTDDLCGICGGRLFRGRWFVGGALSAFHEDGAFIDPPMHSECAHYALQVCPYLAAPRYVKEVGIKKIGQANHDSMILVDNTMMPGRPHGDLFIALMAKRQVVFNNRNCKPLKPFSNIEYWRYGKRVSRGEGEQTVCEALTNFKGVAS